MRYYIWLLASDVLSLHSLTEASKHTPPSAITQGMRVMSPHTFLIDVYTLLGIFNVCVLPFRL